MNWKKPVSIRTGLALIGIDVVSTIICAVLFSKCL